MPLALRLSSRGVAPSLIVPHADGLMHACRSLRPLCCRVAPSLLVPHADACRSLRLSSRRVAPSSLMPRAGACRSLRPNFEPSHRTFCAYAADCTSGLYATYPGLLAAASSLRLVRHAPWSVRHGPASAFFSRHIAPSLPMRHADACRSLRPLSRRMASHLRCSCHVLMHATRFGFRAVAWHRTVLARATC